MTIFEPGSHIHLVGIAGSGMSGIAKILLERGYIVSGSDEKESAVLRSLEAQGAATFVGHQAHHIEGAKYLVISSAISESNPELAAARREGIEVVRRASALARLLPGKFSIAVAGTHGKTTTSGMLAQILEEMGRSPSFVIGSKITALNESAREGSGPEFVVEADESDGSFLEYQPHAAIITNVELDHVDNFHSLDELIELFQRFVATVKDFVVLCHDDANALSLQLPEGVRRISYGFDEHSDLRILDVVDTDRGTDARLAFQGKEIGTLHLSVPGIHNTLNAAAVIATAMGMELGVSESIAAMGTFHGTARRFDIKGRARGVTVIDDYGHHPTEITATLQAARSYLTSHGGGRLGVIFQPHRYSRTEAFFEEFAAALSTADRCIVMDIYSAGELLIPGISSELITSRCKDSTHISDRQQIVAEMKAWSRSGDLILTLGAGDVTELAPLLLQELDKRA